MGGIFRFHVGVQEFIRREKVKDYNAWFLGELTVTEFFKARNIDDCSFSPLLLGAQLNNRPIILVRVIPTAAQQQGLAESSVAWEGSQPPTGIHLV